MSVRRGIPFVVSAPSGTGKTTVCKRIVEADAGLEFSVSHTTRAMRPGETEGVDYHFVTPERFRQMVEEGAFLEWAVYNDNHYGTSWAAIDAPLAAGRDLLIEIEIQGARQVRERRADARFVFLLPPSLPELRQRLESRGTDAPDVIERRLALARTELEALPDFDYAVVNDDLDACVARVQEIVAAERAGRPGPVRERFDPGLAGERLRAAGEAV